MYPNIRLWEEAMARADRGLAVIIMSSAFVLAILVMQRFYNLRGLALARMGIVALALFSVVASILT